MNTLMFPRGGSLLSRCMILAMAVLFSLLAAGCTAPPPKTKVETVLSTAKLEPSKVYVFIDHSLSFTHMSSRYADSRRERHTAAKALFAQKFEERKIDAVIDTHITSYPVMWQGVWLRAASLGASHVLILVDENVSVYRANPGADPTIIGTEQKASYFELPARGGGGKPTLLYETSFSTDETCVGVSAVVCNGFVPNHLMARLDANRLLEKSR